MVIICKCVCVMCCWVPLTPRDPLNERRPQCSVLSTPLSPRGLMSMASFMELTYLILGLPFPHCFLFSLPHCLSQRTLPSHSVPQIEQLQFCHFCPQPCFRLHLLSGRDVCLSGRPGAHRGLLQHRISSESHSPPWPSALPNSCVCACYCKSQFLMRKEAQGRHYWVWSAGKLRPVCFTGSYSFTLFPREPLVHSPQATGGRDGAEEGANTCTAQ